ncbi:MAG: hypothetical protein L6V91_05665 [Bacilli bacterium]|nr:MAG: hypothetical protein L6V91_05665 [Bacilli bacterium]
MLIVIVLGVFGITYALKIATFNPIGINTTTGNITASITYDSTNTSTVTSNNKMLPIADTLVTGVDVTDERILKIKFMVTGSSSNPNNTIYDISLRNIDMSNALKSEYVKWRLYKNGTLLSEGNFSPAFDIKENNRLVLTNTQQDLTTNTDTYVYLMWISEACTGDLSTCDITKNQDKLLGKIFNAQIKLEASTKSKKILTRTAISTYSASMTITNMFTPNKLVEDNNVKYRYDTTNNLMEDVDGNIRYYGASPNNYIYFNCSDYSNQTSSTCETWRIIGVFDGKVKIMRGSVIGTYSWDNKNADTGAETAYGKNDWNTARLMKLLNPNNYYTIDSNDNGHGQRLYWNAQSGTCFSGQNNATRSCDFTSTGLKNDITRNMIAETTYYTRGHSTPNIFVDAMYDKERVSGTVVNATPPRTLTWTGKVAVAYPSDYGYAADLSLCQQTLVNYDNSTCTANNWMKSIITNNGANAGWLLTPHSGYAYHAWYVSSPGNVNNSYSGVHIAAGVVPVLSLTSELDIRSGTGTSSSPYQLSVN